MSRPALAFLHTAATHVAGFGARLRQQAPELQAVHAVDEALLADAQRPELSAADGEALRARVQQRLTQLARSSGAPVVVCTCSTLGAWAEALPAAAGGQVQRIDRAMADAAAQAGPRALVVVALASTVAPTQALLASSADRLQRPQTLEWLHRPEAWALFQRGDADGYRRALADGIRQAVIAAAPPARPDVVVLAQASMAGTEALLADLGLPVLSSPALGVARAAAAARASLASTRSPS